MCCIPQLREQSEIPLQRLKGYVFQANFFRLEFGNFIKAKLLNCLWASLQGCLLVAALVADLRTFSTINRKNPKLTTEMRISRRGLSNKRFLEPLKDKQTTVHKCTFCQKTTPIFGSKRCKKSQNDGKLTKKNQSTHYEGKVDQHEVNQPKGGQSPPPKRGQSRTRNELRAYL